MNGKLKWYIMGAYALMILLLMLNNCRGCSNSHDYEYTDSDTAEVVAVDDETRQEQAAQRGRTGRIKVTALWDFPGDVDLHLTEPSGKEIWFREMKDERTGAELDVDNINGGRGSAENIYIINPMTGRYEVEVVMYRINDDAPRGGEVSVVIKVGDTTQTYRVNLNYANQRETVKIFNYNPN